jgi:transcriptional regulator with XRE-family HTH domain
MKISKKLRKLIGLNPRMDYDENMELHNQSCIILNHVQMEQKIAKEIKMKNLEIEQEIGTYLANLRYHKGLTQKHVSECVGVTIHTIIAVEQGKNKLSIALVFKLLKILNGDAQKLFELVADKLPDPNSQAYKIEKAEVDALYDVYEERKKLLLERWDRKRT